MSRNGGLSLFSIVLSGAVGALLVVGGIWALQGGGDFATRAIRHLFSGDIRNVLVIAFGIVELLSGIFTIVRLFAGDKMNAFGSVLRIIIICVWIAGIVVADFVGIGGALSGGVSDILSWIYDFATHLILVCALLVARE